MKKPTVPWDQVPVDSLRLGRACKQQQHHDAQGQNMRFVSSGHCAACRYKFPPGLFEHTFENVQQNKNTLRRKYHTKEEARAAHIKRQMIWNKNNPEKYRAAQIAYSQRASTRDKRRNMYRDLPEEKKQVVRDRQTAYYRNMSEERKQEVRTMARLRYHERKAELRAAAEKTLGVD